MSGLMQDIRYAIRQLRKSPGFAAVAIVTLALGIGANTAIYTLLDRALLRSLPVRDPDHLVWLSASGSDSGRRSVEGGDPHAYFSYPMYRDIRDQNSVFSGVLATRPVQVAVQTSGQPELAAGELVSGNYFEVLGATPELGRLFVASDDQVQNANPVVVLSYGYWQRRFGSDPRVTSQSLLVNGNPFSIVGVAPSGFHSVRVGETPDVFVPMMMKAEVTPGWNDLDNHRSEWLNIIARLKPGVSAQRAEAGMAPLWYSLRAEELKEIKNSSDRFRDGFLKQSHLSLMAGARGFSPLAEELRLSLLVVMGMVGLVAFMACANVASLLLVRAAGRAREMSVRYALGAKRQRVVQQLVVEALILGLCGGTLGLLLAPRVSALLMRMLFSVTNGDLPFSPTPDFRILAFNFVLAILVSLIFSLAPALQFWRPNLIPALKQQTTTAAAGPLRFRRISVAVQIGLSVVVLVGAGLFVRTLHNLRSMNVGFATDHLLTFGVDPAMVGYDSTKTFTVYRQMLDTLRALPGVRSVAATGDPELSDTSHRNNVTVAGYTEKPDEDMDVEWSIVSAGYLSTLQMPVIAGREILEQDGTSTQKVAVVNETFARHYFGDPQRAIGGHFGDGGGPGTKTDIEIVGVVKDARHQEVRSQIMQGVFTPYLQLPEPRAMSFYVRTWQDPGEMQETLRRAMRLLDPKLALDSLWTMRQQIDDNLRTERVVALLALSFGVLAALMAGIGLYGVLAYSTAQRTREIGVRVALGASRASVMRLVLSEVFWLTILSEIVALPLSVLLARAMRTQLFGVSTGDPATLAAITILVAAVAIGSALLPARRASRIDPIVALRYE
jgi:putative ABC transport system permease protein